MDDDAQDTRAERYEVLEFWGNIDREILDDHDVEIPDELEGEDEVNVTSGYVMDVLFVLSSTRSLLLSFLTMLSLTR